MIRQRRSLSGRLVAYLLFAQIVTLALIPVGDVVVTLTGLAPQWDITIDDWGEYRARAMVAASVRQGRDGAPWVDPTPQLRDYADASPGFRYAVFDYATGKALPGSSTDIVEALGNLDRIVAKSLKFHLVGDTDPTARGLLRRTATPVGAYAVVPYGYHFHSGDLGSVILAFFPLHSLIDLAPMFLAIAGISWLVVRQGLQPLRDAAAQAARIDMDSLDQRIPDGDAPTEVAPFVEAMNAALARLDAGVAAQRRFIANAAHELRTPIAILRAHTDNPDADALRRDVKRDVRRFQTIVEQLLTRARISSGERLTLESVALTDLVLALVADYLPLVVENGRRIEFSGPPEQLVVQGDRWAIECIVSNFIDNALRFEPPGGVILVSVDETACVRVVDHGPGVSEADRDRIFEPFWRKESRTSGAGLGLVISAELAQVLNGDVRFEPTPGGGATFALRLPKASVRRF